MPHRYVVVCKSTEALSDSARISVAKNAERSNRDMGGARDGDRKPMLSPTDTKLGVPVPRSRLIHGVAQVQDAINELGRLSSGCTTRSGETDAKTGPKCEIRAQVLGNGHVHGKFESGLHGRVHQVENARHGAAIASKMLHYRFNTSRLRREGIRVNKLYIIETFDVVAKWYLAIGIDRENHNAAIKISKKGGRSFDLISQHDPESLFTFNFTISEGITQGLVSKVSTSFHLSPREQEHLGSILNSLFTIFAQKDATLLEINPLAWSADGNLTCLSSRFVFDKAAENRQPNVFALRDLSQEVPAEVEAESHGLVYVKLNGNIGCVVNGAGLAMTANDVIQFYGGTSANFLDTGGKANKETMHRAFDIIARDERVQAILVNIYGGLIRCDMVAESIINAVIQLGIHWPMVVRLQGTNSEQGLKYLQEANLGLYIESDLGRAAQRVVELAEAAVADQELRAGAIE